MLAGHRDDVMAVLDAADVFLHPTRADVFPTVLLEALAAGTPIVASRVEGVPEIVDDNHTGLLVPPPLTPAAFAEHQSCAFSDEFRIWRKPWPSAGKSASSRSSRPTAGQDAFGPCTTRCAPKPPRRSGQLRRTTAATRLTVGRA